MKSSRRLFHSHHFCVLTLSVLVPLRNVWAQLPSQHAFYVSPGGHIQHVWNVPGSTNAWSYEDVTGETGAVAAIPALTGFKDDQYNSQEVFYIGSDQHVHHLYSSCNTLNCAGGSPITWLVEDITASTGAPLAGAELTSFKDVQYNSDEVFCIGANQHIYHFFTVPGNPWNVEDITASTSAELARSGLTSFKDVQYNAQQVFYIGTDQHVHHFYNAPGYSWGTEDLTADTGAVLAASGLTSFKDTQYNAQQVFYIGTDQHVHHFYTIPGTPWQIEDISASTGAPPAGFGLTSFKDTQYNAQQVFYIGTDQHVHHFYNVPGTSWGLEDLTASTGASAAGSGLVSFKDAQENLQGVFYIGATESAQDVNYFSSVPGNPWSVQNITTSTGAPTGVGPFMIAWVDSTVTISGHVRSGGSDLSGIAVSLTGTSASGDTVSLSTTTDSSGNYSFFVPFGGTYTVTVANGDTFSPASVSFENVTANQVGDFHR